MRQRRALAHGCRDTMSSGGESVLEEVERAGKVERVEKAERSEGEFIDG